MPLNAWKRAEQLDSADQRIFMFRSWDAYEQLLDVRGDRRFPRITYLDGEIELMSPSEFHDTIAHAFSVLIARYCEARDILLGVRGSWTIKKKRKKGGVEPDASFVFGPGPERRKRPDLAIEVIWTSGGIEKLEIYRRHGVPEVWVWERGAIHVFALEHGKYRSRRRSMWLPDIDLRLLAKMVQHDYVSKAMKSWRRALRKRRQR